MPQVPFLFKHTVDAVAASGEVASIATAGLAAPAALMAAYGAARAGSSLMSELRNAVFAKVAQGTIRKVGNQVLAHLHELDLSYHLSRQTGGLSRAIDRGTRGINFILSAMVFNVVPTALEVVLVSGILAYKCGPTFAALSVATLAAYTVFTFQMTAWRTKFRVDMNKMEAAANTRALDSLLNYETVRRLQFWTCVVEVVLMESTGLRAMQVAAHTDCCARSAACLAEQLTCRSSCHVSVLTC